MGRIPRGRFRGSGQDRRPDHSFVRRRCRRQRGQYHSVVGQRVRVGGDGSRDRCVAEQLCLLDRDGSGVWDSEPDRAGQAMELLHGAGARAGRFGLLVFDRDAWQFRHPADDVADVVERCRVRSRRTVGDRGTSVPGLGRDTDADRGPGSGVCSSGVVGTRPLLGGHRRLFVSGRRRPGRGDRPSERRSIGGRRSAT